MPSKIVLIESDWNLKGSEPTLSVQRQHRINRIRLEFKGIQPSESAWLTSVLIESDWNLKSVPSLPVTATAGINRIRLEFKVMFSSVVFYPELRINRIRLEFKGLCFEY